MKSQLSILLAGYGDIAQRLVKHPSLSNDHFIAVKRSESSPEKNLVALQGDLRDNVFAQSLVNKADVIVATISPDKFSDEGYRDSYEAVARSLAESVTANEKKPGLILWVSSTSVYGENNGECVDEMTPASPVGFSGKRLLQAEKIIQAVPTKTVVVRFSGIYGPGRMRTLENVKQGTISTEEGSPWSNRIHSDDCAGVLAHLVDLYRQGRQLEDIYLATDNLPVTLHQVHRWLAEQMNISDLRETASRGRANRRCANQRLLASGYKFKYPDYRSGYAELISAFETVK